MPSSNSTENNIAVIIDRHAGDPGGLLPALHDIQTCLGYIPADCVPQIAAGFNQSRAEIHGVITFYRHFRQQPPARHTIELCRAEACQATGSRELEQHVQRRLGIGYGEQTSDGVIGLEPVYCLGNCACTPSLAVNGRVHAHMNSERFDALLKVLRQDGGDG